MYNETTKLQDNVTRITSAFNRSSIDREETLRRLHQQRTRCEVWTRVMGYHRPVSAFNPGKQAEHAERRMFYEGQISNPVEGQA